MASPDSWKDCRLNELRSENELRGELPARRDGLRFVGESSAPSGASSNLTLPVLVGSMVLSATTSFGGRGGGGGLVALRGTGTISAKMDQAVTPENG